MRARVERALWCDRTQERGRTLQENGDCRRWLHLRLRIVWPPTLTGEFWSWASLFVALNPAQTCCLR